MPSSWARVSYMLLLLTAVAVLWVEVDHATAGLVAILGTLVGQWAFWYADRRGLVR